MANCFGPIKYLCDVIHVPVLAIVVAVCANHLIIFYGGEHLWLIFCFRWGCARVVQICRITKHSKELSTRAIYDIENNMQSFKVTKTTCQMVHRAHPTNQFNQPTIVFARMRGREKERKKTWWNFFRPLHFLPISQFIWPRAVVAVGLSWPLCTG